VLYLSVVVGGEVAQRFVVSMLLGEFVCCVKGKN